MDTRVNWLAVTRYNRVKGHILWTNVSLDDDYFLLLKIFGKIAIKRHYTGDAERIMEKPRTQSYHEPRDPYYIELLIAAVLQNSGTNAAKYFVLIKYREFVMFANTLI